MEKTNSSTVRGVAWFKIPQILASGSFWSNKSEIFESLGKKNSEFISCSENMEILQMKFLIVSVHLKYLVITNLNTEQLF